MGCDNMRKTAVLMQIKLAVIRLRNENQSIRNIAKTLGQQFGSSLTRKKTTGELNVKRQRKATVVDDQRILYTSRTTDGTLQDANH